MFNTIRTQLRTGLTLLMVLTLLTGFIYPLVVTGLAQCFFPWKANGSLMVRHDKVIGSLNIGQAFSSPHYFWGRPSATLPVAYNGAASAASNLGPSNPALLTRVHAQMAAFKTFTSKAYPEVPLDLVTASASGLDPDISPFAALFQVARVARARHIPESELQAFVLNQIQPRTFGLLGEPRINVLALNVLLDNLETIRTEETHQEAANAHR